MSEIQENTQDNIQLDSLFFQCAQDPLDGLDHLFPAVKENDQPKKKEIQKRRRRRNEKPSKPSGAFEKNKLRPSFLINGEACRGRRVIKIQILDISESEHDSDSNVLLSAQYVVKDSVVNDDIMDQTERVISNISKKLCGYSYNF